MIKNMDAETYCGRCSADFEGWRVGINGTNKGWEEVICYSCDLKDRIEEYKKTGTMTARLTMTAIMANNHFKYRDDTSGLRLGVGEIYARNRDVFLEIAAKDDQINSLVSEWEKKNWMGKDGLQRLYQKSKSRGHIAVTKTYKIMMWGCAGRVIVTIQDRYAAENPKSKFGGAVISLIFDETSKECRGGVQSYCATLEEALGLLLASMDKLPTLKPDEKVSIAL